MGSTNGILTLFGEDEPILTNIFQLGWFNHQPDYLHFLCVVPTCSYNTQLLPCRSRRRYVAGQCVVGTWTREAALPPGGLNGSAWCTWKIYTTKRRWTEVGVSSSSSSSSSFFSGEAFFVCSFFGWLIMYNSYFFLQNCCRVKFRVEANQGCMSGHFKGET